MNKFKIFQAPFLSLYSLSFYREVLNTSLREGLTYLAFLSLIASVLAGITFNARSIPETKAFVQWLKSSAPPLMLTPEGLQMAAPSPYVMTHPRFVPLVTLDLSKTTAQEKDFQEGTLLFLTAKRGFFRSQNRVRAFDYVRGNENFKPVPITGEIYEKSGKVLRRILLAGVPAAVFLFFFVWKLTVALIYSGFAGLINRFRQEPVSYPALLNLCLFAMTAFVLIEFTTLLIPGFEIRGGFFTGLMMTSLYLGLVLHKTDVDSLEKAVL